MGCTVLALELASGVEYHSDQVMTGLVEDQRIEMWGNISIPEGGQLELRNVTVVFHPGAREPFGIRGYDDCTLVITDGDGNPDTMWDASNITSTTDPWFIIIDMAERFEVRNSMLSNMGRRHADPVLGDRWTSRINANVSMVNRSRVGNLELPLRFMGSSVTINGSTIRSQYTVYLDVDSASISESSLEVSLISGEGTEAFIMTRTAVRGGSITIENFDVTELSSCSFVGGGFIVNPYDLTHHYDLTVIDCEFDTPGSCSLYCIVYNLTISGCKFINGTDGLYASTRHMEIDDCVFKGNQGCIRVTNAVFMNVTNVSFLDSISAILVSSQVGAIYLEGLTFDNCTFGIRDNEYTGFDIATWISIANCTINETNHGIRCLNRYVSISNVTIDSGSKAPSQGVVIEVKKLHFTCTVNIAELQIVNATSGIEAMAYTSTSVDINMERLNLLDCDAGIVCRGMRQLVLDGIVVDGAREAVNINRTYLTVVHRLDLWNCTDGLSVKNCQMLEVHDIRFENMVGISVEHEQINYATWNISHDLEIYDTQLILVGTVLVTAKLLLVDIDLQMMGIHDQDDGLIVEGEGELALIRSYLHGTKVHPFRLKVHDGATLLSRETEIAHCGGLSNNVSQTGPFIEGGSHNLHEVTIRDCQSGLVLYDSRVTISDCQISANRTGIVARGSDISIKHTNIEGSTLVLDWVNVSSDLSNCSLNSSLIGAFLTESDVLLCDSILSASVRAVELTDSSFTLERCSIHCDGELFRVRRSDVQMWNTYCTPLRTDGGTVDGGHVKMYDCTYLGGWTVADAIGKVEKFWHYDVSARLRWNGDPASGMEVYARDGAGGQGQVLLGTTDDEGSLERVWLAETVWTSAGEQQLAPYTLSITTTELRAEALLPESKWAEVELLMVDYVDPVVIIDSPTNGSFHDQTNVSITGSVSDGGSGIDGLELSFDGGIWGPVALPEDGRLTMLLVAFDGSHSVHLRAKDRDGNQCITELRLTIDTLPPMVAFASPEAMTAYGDDLVTLEGLVILDEGTAIDRCTINDFDLVLDEDGGFTLQVVLQEEGENVFIARVFDMAGNVGITNITLLKDTTPPVLRVNEVPRYTKDGEVTVRGTVIDLLETLLTVNGRFGASLVNGTFEFNVTLVIGRNVLLFEAVDALGNEAWSVHLVDLDNLINGTVDHPVEGQEVEGKGVLVRVSTDPDTWVRVHDHTDWTHTLNGSLELWVELEPANETVLLVEFRDRANNTLERAVTVVQIDPAEEEGTILPWWTLVAVIAVGTIVIVALWTIRRE